jgi:DNA primase
VQRCGGSLHAVGIKDEDVAAVREAADLVAIVGQYTQLKRVGRNFSGLCPFHSEKTPSFSVNGEKGFFYCFGCQAKGDVISFVREIEHLDFVGAVEWLAAKTGITLRYTDENEGENRRRRAKLIEAVGRAVDWYHERLRTAPDAGPARSYLRSRGFTREMVERYRLGWAPDDWDQLAKALGLPDDILRDAGLGFVNRRGRQQDAFRGRVLFPIFDVNGDPVGFGGRILPGAEGAKYINSHESPIYAKSRVLYGLNWAKSDIVAADEVVVCEGYTDVIAFAEAGVPRAVATCGTALTESHVQVLRKYARRVVLAFDADSAGLAAAERFYEWERQFEIDVAVAALPAGIDPADLGRRDPDALQASITGARPFLGFRLERVLSGADLSRPEGRARAAEAALAVVGEHPNPLVRDQYLMTIADRCRIDVDQLREQLRNPGRRRPAPDERRPAPDRAAPVRTRATPAIEALRVLVHRPDEIRELLDESLFDDEVEAAAFRALLEHPSVRDAIDAADPATADLLQRVVVSESEADAFDVATRLVEEATRLAIEDLEAQIREAPTESERLVFAPTLSWLTKRRMELRDEHVERTAFDQLLAWHRQRAIGER